MFWNEFKPMIPMKMRLPRWQWGLLLMLLWLAPRADAQQIGESGFQQVKLEKRAQTGLKFLSMSLDPRLAAMGSAATAQTLNTSLALLYNPATMAQMTDRFHLALMQAQWIADIRYNGGTLAFSPSGGIYGVFGVSVVAVDYGEFLGTIRADNESGYEDIGTYSPTALAVGFGYARALSDRFAVGGQVKYVRQDLGTFPVAFGDGGDLISKDYNKSTIAFDFGVIYHTGFRSLTFAASARNFSRELKYEQENFEPPLTFRIGVAMNLLDLTNQDPNMHKLLVAIDAERPRDFDERLHIGAEYVLMNTLALRAGYIYPSDVEGASLGVGIQQRFGSVGFMFNYAYTAFDTFDNVNRLGIQLSF
ncbi:hypothetical protein Rmar_1748 [Rhodothermus marinus DSM 4252]|uniref:PorV/PorQ family protein n=2 Tax=Rhodothermus marinus TaxID=29549 RepID=D0MJH4_RHOM4|nr:hypothetical protein Rmar_1748 [Rhodothermus marinus DSM 4252]